MRPLVWPALLGMLVVIGCTQPAPPVYEVERSRVYTVDEPELQDRLRRFLTAQGIEPTGVERTTGMILATRAWDEDLGWADCEAAWVRDRSSNSNRSSRARRGPQQLDLRVGLAEAGGSTEVEVDARFAERQINPFTNSTFQQPCRSTGVLERALLDALEGPPTAGEPGAGN